MMVKTRLAEIQEELSRQFSGVALKGHGRASFLHVTNNGRGVEISENDDHLWLEFWEKDDDENASPVNEKTVMSCDHAIQETKQWLG